VVCEIHDALSSSVGAVRRRHICLGISGKQDPVASSPFLFLVNVSQSRLEIIALLVVESLTPIVSIVEHSIQQFTSSGLPLV
jgi:hypothetical protein